MVKINTERWYAEYINYKFYDDKGKTEYVLPDRSRVDILTDSMSWEVEWAKKWPEAIGQAIFYGLSTDCKPGIWLLMPTNSDKYYLRCLMVCRQLDIKLGTFKISEHVKDMKEWHRKSQV